MPPFSPLRYPGGKARFYPIVRKLIEKNKLEIDEYFEPYAGGAGLALAILMSDTAKAIHINDIDRSIYAFWISVLEHTRSLCARIRNARMTVEEWQYQKSIQLDQTASVVELGFSTLYLNRTNRSGIIKRASLIGGLDQSGPWKMGVRFNKEGLISRIKDIASRRDRINIYNMDAIRFLRTVHTGRRSLTYLDPPYFEKGRRLYTSFYQPSDHREIAQFIHDELPGYWLLSYDNVGSIRELYQQYRKATVRTRYSAAEKRQAAEILVFAEAFKHTVRMPALV